MILNFEKYINYIKNDVGDMLLNVKRSTNWKVIHKSYEILDYRCNLALGDGVLYVYNIINKCIVANNSVSPFNC